MLFDALVDDLAELLFADEEIDLKLEDVLRVGAVNKAEILRVGRLKIMRPIVVSTRPV